MVDNETQSGLHFLFLFTDQFSFLVQTSQIRTSSTCVFYFILEGLLVKPILVSHVKSLYLKMPILNKMVGMYILKTILINCVYTRHQYDKAKPTEYEKQMNRGFSIVWTYSEIEVNF